MRQQVDEICLHYPCERCGALRGAWCTTGSGMLATYLHASRFTQAVEAGELPLTGDDQAV